MTMGVLFFVGCTLAVAACGGWDAIRDWDARRRIRRLIAEEHSAADAFAVQLEEIRDLPEVAA